MAIRCILATVPGWFAWSRHSCSLRARWPGAARLLRDDRGASASQYVLVAALICLAIIGSLTTLGANISAMYSKPTNIVKSLGT